MTGEPQGITHPSISIINCLESEVAITLCCQLCYTHYQAVQIKKYLKSNCIIKVAYRKNTDNFPLQKESIDTFCCQQR